MGPKEGRSNETVRARRRTAATRKDSRPLFARPGARYLGVMISLLAIALLASPPPSAPDLEAFARAIAPLHTLSVEIAWARADRCADAIMIAARPSDGRAIKCLATDDQTRCAAWAKGDDAQMKRERGRLRAVHITHPAESLCNSDPRPTVPPPAWLAEVISAARAGVTVTPFTEGGGLIVYASDPDYTKRYHVALRRQSRWSLALLHTQIGFGGLTGPTRQLDTTRLTGRPSIGVISTWDEGGSQMGRQRTWLTIYAHTPDALRPIGELPLGHFRWWASPEQRGAAPPGAAHDLDLRAHDEVRLSLSLDRGALTLTDETPKLCAEVREETRAGDDRAFEVRDLAEVCRAAGRWRLGDDGFVRVEPAAEPTAAP